MSNQKWESHVVSLEIAKQLKEAGWKKETEFIWNEQKTYLREGQKDGTSPYKLHSSYADLLLKDSEEIVLGNDDFRGDYRTVRDIFPAPLATEILEELPSHIKLIKQEPLGYQCYTFKLKDSDDDWMKFKSITACDSLAKMWLYLKKENQL